jgi:hypothetical protein
MLTVCALTGYQDAYDLPHWQGGAHRPDPQARRVHRHDQVFNDSQSHLSSIHTHASCFVCDESRTWRAEDGERPYVGEGLAVSHASTGAGCFRSQRVCAGSTRGDKADAEHTTETQKSEWSGVFIFLATEFSLSLSLPL